MHINWLLVPLAAFTLAPTLAAAADYDPPIVVDEMPEYVPVEVGSGWYLRGDLTYNVDEPVYDFTLLGEDTDNIRIGGTVGAGYHFTDYLRSDINVGFLGRDRYELGGGIASATNDMWAGMFNTYLDLGTIAGLTPYVGAGVGLLYSKQDFDVGGVSLYDDTQYRFAYGLNAGVNYQLTQNLSVDLGYQYLNSPKTEYIDSDTLTVEEGVDFHQVRVGLRYELW